MKPPACEICGGSRHRRLWSLRFDNYPGSFQLWRCADCGLVMNWPRLSPDAIRACYDGDYYVFSSPPAQRWSRATHLYASLLLPLEARVRGSRLLEVGCARGELLALAAARGWQVHGIELSPEAARSAKADYGVPVTVGPLEGRNGERELFDVVIATDVIEHVPSPRAFLLAVRPVVNNGGYVIIQTPNWGSGWRRLAGRRWLGINEFHLFLFNAACLRRLIRQCGFSQCKAHSVANPSCVEWGCRRELAMFRNSLPEALKWRAEYWLNRITPRSLATTLQRDPPADFQEALARIKQLEHGDIRTANARRVTGDNLVVVGRVRSRQSYSRQETRSYPRQGVKGDCVAC